METTPHGALDTPAVFAEVGNLLLEAFTDGGVPTWEISKKTEEQGEWNIIVKGTADSFEAAKAAALFEGGAGIMRTIKAMRSKIDLLSAS